MEKADILEMTVKHLQNLQKQQQQTISIEQHQNTVLQKYRSGFNECVSEVSRFIAQLEDIEVNIKQRLVTYLANLILMPNPKVTSSLTNLGSFNESILMSTSSISLQPQSTNNSSVQSQLPKIHNQQSSPLPSSSPVNNLLPVHSQTHSQLLPLKGESINHFPGDVNNNFNTRIGLLPNSAASPQLLNQPNTALSLVLPKNNSFTPANTRNTIVRENSAFTTVNPKKTILNSTVRIMSPSDVSSPSSTNYCDENFHNLRFYKTEVPSVQSSNSSLSNSDLSHNGSLSSSSSSSTFNDQHSQVSSSTNISPESSISSKATKSTFMTFEKQDNQYYHHRHQNQNQIDDNDKVSLLTNHYRGNFESSLKRKYSDHAADCDGNDYKKAHIKRIAIHLSSSETSAFQPPKSKLDINYEQATNSLPSTNNHNNDQQQNVDLFKNDMWRPW